MRLDELFQENRVKERVAIYKFIATASVEELASIISEIRVCHDNIMVFNRKHKSVDCVVSVGVNGECIQLNLEV